MGKPWCVHLPVVTVPQAGMPKPVTIIVPFYMNHGFLQRQLEHWDRYPAIVKAHLRGIIVDDGSPTPAELPAHLPFPIRLFRIEQDIRWNWLAARNIAFHHAPEGWCLVTDIDHIVPAETIVRCQHGQHHDGTIYGFSRQEHTGEPLTPHPNSWFLTRQMFWRVGGYDETLSGHYGTDGEYRRRCAQTAKMAILSDHLIRHEHIGDSSTTAYLRKQPEDAGVKALIAKRQAGWRPKVLSYAYHEVTHDGQRDGRRFGRDDDGGGTHRSASAISIGAQGMDGGL